MKKVSSFSLRQLSDGSLFLVVRCNHQHDSVPSLVLSFSHSKLKSPYPRLVRYAARVCAFHPPQSARSHSLNPLRIFSSLCVRVFFFFFLLSNETDFCCKRKKAAYPLSEKFSLCPNTTVRDEPFEREFLSRLCLSEPMFTRVDSTRMSLKQL